MQAKRRVNASGYPVPEQRCCSLYTGYNLSCMLIVMVIANPAREALIKSGYI